jgi:hypothetical protein
MAQEVQIVADGLSRRTTYHLNDSKEVALKAGKSLSIYESALPAQPSNRSAKECRGFRQIESLRSGFKAQ